MFAQVSPPRPCTRQTRKQAGHVARNPPEPLALLQLTLDIGDHFLYHLNAIRERTLWMHMMLEFGQEVRVMIGLPADHGTVDLLDCGIDLLNLGDAAVQHDLQVGVRLLEAINTFVVQGRYRTILFGAEPLENGNTRMHDELATPGLSDDADKTPQEFIAVLVVDANAGFDSHRHIDGRHHFPNASGNDVRVRHQAGAEPAVLYPVRRAADVDIHLVIPGLCRFRGSFRHQHGIAAAELDGQGVLGRIKAQQGIRITVMQCIRRDHLRVQACARAQQPHEIAAVPIRPVHHRGNRNHKGKILAGHGCFQQEILVSQ